MDSATEHVMDLVYHFADPDYPPWASAHDIEQAIKDLVLDELKALKCRGMAMTAFAESYTCIEWNRLSPGLGLCDRCKRIQEIENAD